jgi:hypothetical protein
LFLLPSNCLCLLWRRLGDSLLLNNRSSFLLHSDLSYLRNLRDN